MSQNVCNFCGEYHGQFSKCRLAQPSECKHQNLIRHDLGGQTWWQCEDGCDFLFRLAALAEKPAERPADPRIDYTPRDLNEIEYGARMYQMGRRHVREEESAERPQLSAEQVLSLAKGIVTAAVELAVLRGNLCYEDSPPIDVAQCAEVVTDTWNAMQGIDTCSEEECEELKQFRAALLTGVPPKEEQFKAIAKELGDNGYCSYIAVEEVLRKHLTAPAAPPVLQAEPSDNERIPQDSDERVLLYIYGANNLAERKAIMAAIRREAEQEARLDEAKWWYDAWDGEQIFKATERLAGMKSALADYPVSGDEKKSF